MEHNSTNSKPSPKETQNRIVPTEFLRNKIRQCAKTQRERQRANMEDSIRFGLGEITSFIEQLDNLTEKDIVGISNRIKRRKHATPEDMYRLSHAFLQGLHNIVAFSKIPGALQILIKELTGKHAECQIRAAECLCNLSLGDAPVCDKIATMAGSYLVTYIHSTEAELVRLCLWTITNILATDSNTNDSKNSKGFHILMKMELLPQLWKLYVNDNNIWDSSIDYREDVALCLQVIALNPIVYTQMEYYNFFLQHANEKKPPPSAIASPIISAPKKGISNDGSEYHLQIIFHTLFHNEDSIRNFSKSFCTYLINYALSNIYVTPQSSSDIPSSGSSLPKQVNMKESMEILYAIRILSNLLASHQMNDILILLQLQLSLLWHTDLLCLLNKLFSYNNDALTFEALWFLQNILSKMAAENTNANSSEINCNLNNLLDKLYISYGK